MVADYCAIAAMRYVDARGIVLAIRAREPFEPRIQCGIPAFEGAEIVLRRQLLDYVIGARRHQRLSATGTRENRRFRPAGTVGGRSNYRRKAFHFSFGRTKWFWSAKSISACEQSESMI